MLRHTLVGGMRKGKTVTLRHNLACAGERVGWGARFSGGGERASPVGSPSVRRRPGVRRPAQREADVTCLSAVCWFGGECSNVLIFRTLCLVLRAIHWD